MSEDDATRPTAVNRRQVLKATGSALVFGAAGTATAQDEVVLPEKAKDVAAADEDASEGELEVVDERVVTYETLEGEFYEAKVMDRSTGTIETVRLDEAGREVDRATVRGRADAAFEEEYGLLTRSLHERLQEAEPGEEIDVAVVTDDTSRNKARRRAKAASSNGQQPSRDRMREAYVEHVESVTASLGRQIRQIDGASVQVDARGIPIVKAAATPAAVDRIQDIPSVWKVFEQTDPEDIEPDMQEAAKTLGSWDGRDDVYDASGECAVGVHEAGGHTPDELVNKIAEYPESADGTHYHAHMVALCAASTDGDLPGTARSADVYSSQILDSNDDPVDYQNLVDWYLDQGVSVINQSWSAHSDHRELTDLDIRHDSAIFSNDIQVVNSAGNVDYRSGTARNVSKAARGFNILSIGAVSDANDGSDLRNDVRWSTDDHIGGSRYIDPLSEYDDDHDKPEISAVGHDIEFPVDFTTVPGIGTESSGTSFSAPQVSGLIALLEKFYDESTLADGEQPEVVFPEVNKAIALACAQPAGDWSFDRLGVGTVQVPAAERIVKNDWYANDEYHRDTDSESITIPDVQAGETVTVVLNWLSDTSSANFTDNANAHPDVSFDFAVHKDGLWQGTATNSARGYQWLRFQAPEDGDYTAVVQKDYWENDNDDLREYCVSWHRWQDTEPPSAPGDLTSNRTTATSMELEWEKATNQGGSEMDHYDLEVVNVGVVDSQELSPETRSTSVTGLSPDESYTVYLTAVDEAGNSNRSSTVVTTDPETLLVNDYDGDANWPDENDLGEAIGKNVDHAELLDGAVRLEHSGEGYYVEGLYRDLSDHSEIQIRIRGDAGGENEQFKVVLSDGTTLEPVGRSHVGTSFSTLSYSLEGLDTDLTDVNSAGLQFTSGSGAVELAEVRVARPDPLALHDFDADTTWPDQNQLGNAVTAEDFANGSGTGAITADGNLRLEYTLTSGVVRSVIDRDLSSYEELQIRLRGDTGDEGSQVTVRLGGEDGCLETLSADELDDEFATMRISLADLDPDALHPQALELEFDGAPNDSMGEFGSLEIDSIYFVADAAADPIGDVQPLVLNDYDGDSSWPQGNDLGGPIDVISTDDETTFDYWLDGKIMDDESLRIEHTNGGAGAYLSHIDHDLQRYSDLELTIRGDRGLEGMNFGLMLGTADVPLWEATRDSIQTEYSTVTVDLDNQNVNRVTPLLLGFDWNGVVPLARQQSAIEIDEIKFYNSEPLVVNDFDGDQGWPSSNDLGGSISHDVDDATVIDETLRLEYSGSGSYQTDVDTDVSDYKALKLRVRGDAGGEESDLALSLGGVSEPLANLTRDTIGTSFDWVTVYTDVAGVDETSPGTLELDFAGGESNTGAIEISEIRFEESTAFDPLWVYHGLDSQAGWPDENLLGEPISWSGFDDVYGADDNQGSLRLEYSTGGVYTTEVHRDLTDVTAIEMEMVADSGSPGSDCTIEIGDVSATLEEATREPVPTDTPRFVTIDMEAMGVDTSSVDDIVFDFSDPSESGTLSIGWMAFQAPRPSREDLLTVNDYERGNWPDENFLGESITHYLADVGVVEDEYLRMEYTEGTSHFYLTDVNRDVTQYEELQLLVRGDSGGEESEFLLAVDGDGSTLSNLTDDVITTDWRWVSVDLAANGMDSADAEDVLFDFGYSAADDVSGAIEVARLRFR